MNQMFVRLLREQELEKMLSWAVRNPAWDTNVLRYAGSFVMAAFNESGVIGFLPVQQPMMMEAVCFHPLATDQQKALAMKELTHALIYNAYVRGAGEIYFLGSDNGTNTFAAHQGFTKLEMPTYRVRLANLETGAEPVTPPTKYS